MFIYGASSNRSAARVVFVKISKNKSYIATLEAEQLSCTEISKAHRPLIACQCRNKLRNLPAFFLDNLACKSEEKLLCKSALVQLIRE